MVWKSSQETWARLHEQAWRYFGGACRYVVLDNLKEGVIKPDLYEPQLNAVTSRRKPCCVRMTGLRCPAPWCRP